MLIGVPKEIKNHEYRVGVTPSGVQELVSDGHSVIVEKNCGNAVGFTDNDYINAGATIATSVEEIFQTAEMIVKVKEPQPNECKMLRPDQILFTYLHLAPDLEQTELLLASGANCVAYETITDDRGGLPLLAPMSEVAGRMSIQAAAHCLEKANGGSGVLLGGVPGVEPGRVLILGGGVVGINAARIAVGMGADVTILDKSLPRLRTIDEMFNCRIRTLFSNKANILEQLKNADAVIGAVLIPGAKAPKLITKDMLRIMKKGSVLVDVAIDQGGCFETSRPTTHNNPTYIVDDIVHYCVANMPGAVARTSTIALTNATLPFVSEIARKGLKDAVLNNAHLYNGLNIYRNQCTYKAVADIHNLTYVKLI